MTAVARTRSTTDRMLLHGVLLGVAVVLGVALALEPYVAAGVAVGTGLLVLVVVRPVAGAAMVIVASLLLAGIDRGALVPLLRPQEAVLGLVLVGLAIRLAAGVVSPRARLPVWFDRVDVAIVFMAFSASILPLAFMLIRDRPIEGEDILYGLQLWKLYAVFLAVRIAVRTPEDVGRCLWIAMGAAVVVGMIGLLQSLGLAGVQDFLEQHFKPEEQDAASFDLTRATSTVSSPFAVGDTMIFSAAIAAGLFVRGHPRRTLLAGLVGLFLLSAVSAGQFSIAIGIVVAVAAFGLISRRLGRSLAALLVLAVVAGVVLQPVIQNRLRSFDNSAGVPKSWEGRIENLDVFFLPPLMSEANWLTGVRPAARVPAPEPWREYVYIESGHVWLLWTGGITLLIAFAAFLAVAMTRAARVARARGDPIGAAGAASFTALAVVAVLMVLDVHLTLRGAGELSFWLLGLALIRPRDEER